MEIYETTVDQKQRFVEILTKYNACLHSDRLKGVFGSKINSDLFFDLDILWHEPQGLKDTSTLVHQIADSLRRQRQFTSIAVITSNVGSYGGVPFATLLAKEYALKLFVFREREFGAYQLQPLTKTLEDEISGKKFLIFKDVTVYGQSVTTVSEIITKYGGECSVFLTLVDFEPPDRQGFPPPQLTKTLTCTLLMRRDFDLLRRVIK